MKKAKQELLKLQFSIFKNFNPKEIYHAYEYVLDDFLDSREYVTNLIRKKIKKELEPHFLVSINLFKKNLSKNKDLFFTTYCIFFLKDIFNEFVTKYPNSIKKK